MTVTRKENVNIWKKEEKKTLYVKRQRFHFISSDVLLIFLFINLLPDTLKIDQIGGHLVFIILLRLIYSSIYPQSCKLSQKGVLYRREYRTSIFVNNNTIHSKQIYRRHEEELAGVLWYTLSLKVKIQNTY